MDPRIEKLADLLVSYSCRVQEGEKVLISYEGDCCKPLVKQIIRNVYKKGGMPFTEIRDSEITREVLMGCRREQAEFINECQLAQMKGMQAYIAIRAGNNSAELSDVPKISICTAGSRHRRWTTESTTPSGSSCATLTHLWHNSPDRASMRSRIFTSTYAR